jgi:hypothetical protein
MAVTAQLLAVSTTSARAQRQGGLRIGRRLTVRNADATNSVRLGPSTVAAAAGTGSRRAPSSRWMCHRASRCTRCATAALA